MLSSANSSTMEEFKICHLEKGKWLNFFFAADSWVDVHFQNSGGNNSPKKDSEGQAPLNIEKLLKDAQREFTNNSSRDTSARGRLVSL